MSNILSDSFQVNTFETPLFTEYYIHAHGHGGSDIPKVFDEAFRFLMVHQAMSVFFRIFGNETLDKEIAKQYQDRFSQLACPVSWMTKEKPGNESSFEIQIKAITNPDIKPLFYKDFHVGCRYEDNFFNYYKLSLTSDKSDGSDFDQAAGLFDRYQAILTDLGLDFSNTIRTWLFETDILGWYDQLNAARSGFFTQHDIFNKLVPASTGIGLTNPAGAAMQTELLAVVPKNADAVIQAVESPLQCSALDYKSSFSRAVKIQAPDYAYMTVSGTASIAPEGETIHIDDTPKQIELTMQVVEALLENGGMTWKNVTNAIVYFKHRQDIHLFEEYCRNCDLEIPHVLVNADVCRDNLLFEIELDASSRG